MAKNKKNFKGGLDNLIETSLGITKEDIVRQRAEKDDNSDNNSNSLVDSKEIEYLKNKIADLKSELFLWRTGKINPESFIESLKNYGLIYNQESNEIEQE
ncbi:MAG: hypothetical protein MJ211_00035 [Bacteroidales bacterium]|nr:hypothetical protein [Bacteroidales bacterium]